MSKKNVKYRIQQLEDRIKELESKKDNKASSELFKKIQAIREEEGDSTDYVDVDVPEEAYSTGCNLFPYIRKALKQKQ